MGHAPAEAVEIEPQPRGGIEQHARAVVQREAARLGLFEHALGSQVAKHAGERVLVGTGFLREHVDAIDAFGKVLGDAERDHDVDAPGRGEIAQRPDVARGHPPSLLDWPLDIAR